MYHVTTGTMVRYHGIMVQHNCKKTKKQHCSTSLQPERCGDLSYTGSRVFRIGSGMARLCLSDKATRKWSKLGAYCRLNLCEMEDSIYIHIKSLTNEQVPGIKYLPGTCCNAPNTAIHIHILFYSSTCIK